MLTSNEGTVTRNAGPTRTLIIALGVGLVLAACGQKPGIHVEGPVVANPQGGGTGGEVVDTTGGTVTDTTDGGVTSTDGVGTTSGTVGTTTGTVGTTSGTSGTTTGTTSGTSGDSTTDGSAGTTTGTPKQTPIGNDRTGVTADKITIGVHAPVTGAAPIPATSFRDAKDLYWQWHIGTKKRQILGRSSVEVLFADDKYDPADARPVCRELARNAFLVTGGGGTDQIQACGAQAKVQEYLYFSAGVTEAGLNDNPWYFAASMTYRQQGILLANYLKKHFPGQRFAMIVTDTPNFQDAIQGFETGVDQAGIRGDYYGVIKHTKGDTTWYSSVASTLSNEVDIIYILSSPTDYINFAKQAKKNGYGPKAGGGFQYVGVGVTMGLNAVLPTGCGEGGAVDGGIFFSPFPGLDWAHKNEPDFFQAAKDYGKVPDDLAFALWGLNKQFDSFLALYGDTYGTDLTREDYRNLAESTPSLKTNLFPEIGYSASNHFGGKQVHVLQANCTPTPEGQLEHVTLQSFVSAF